MNFKTLFAVFLSILAIGLYANTALAVEVGPKITFTFDDGNDRVFTKAAPVLDIYNMPAVMYGETGPLNSGEDWVMTWDQVRELRDLYGWEIGSHTINHPYLTTLTDAGLVQELLGAKNDFAAEGIDVKSFATPYGDYDDRVLTAIARYYESHRAAWGGPNFWPDYFNDYELVCLEAKHTTTPEEVQGWVDLAIANNQWLILLLHDIVDGVAAEYEYNVDDFAQIVDYVATKPINVTTLSKGLELTNQPNLINNFSFSDLDNTNWAENWTRTDSTKVTIDTGDHGNVYEPENSIKISAGAGQYEVVSELVNVDSSAEYLLKMYQNVQNLSAGGWAVWVNEYDNNTGWLGGQWLGGNYSNFIGNRYYEYKPTSAGVEKVQIHIYSEANSQFTLYVDSVFFYSLEATIDTTPPVITLLGDPVMNLIIGDAYIEPGATAEDDVDGDITGSIIIAGDTVNTLATGTYLITYNVSDAAGNNAPELVRTVNVTEEVNDNAYLSDLKVDGVTVAGFSPLIFDYTVELPAGTLIVPTVTAIADDAGSGIGIAITAASSLPGTTLIVVTAEDMVTTNTYTVNFIFAGPAESLVANFSFEDLTNGWANYWTRLDGNIVIDTNNNGYNPYPRNSLKITGGANQRVVMSSMIDINASENYELWFYQKIVNYASGGAAVWVSEFDSNNSYVSGSWLGGSYKAWDGIRLLDYTPTSSQVSKINIHLFTESNSYLTLYIDSVVLKSK
ncbi:DUF5011 domain-containing protein [bacterium]|nr:DUF5011 domain-containing protein [bacterium]